MISVIGTEDLLVITDKGIIIRTPIDQISITKRATQGVKIINLLKEHVVSTVALVNSNEEELETEEENVNDEIKDTEELNEEESKVEEIINDSF